VAASRRKSRPVIFSRFDAIHEGDKKRDGQRTTAVPLYACIIGVARIKN